MENPWGLGTPRQNVDGGGFEVALEEEEDEEDETTAHGKQEVHRGELSCLAALAVTHSLTGAVTGPIKPRKAP